jgi:hypothetical protein
MDTLSLAMCSLALALFLRGSYIVVSAVIRHELPLWALIAVVFALSLIVAMVFFAAHQTPTVHPIGLPSHFVIRES